MWSRIIAILLLLQIANACDTDGDIRLAGGSNEFEGRVEVCNNSVWNTVCDDNWGAEEAAVVCRQLGRFNGSHLIPVGRGTGSIIMVRWECIGTETHLLQCQMDMTSLKCGHTRDAGVFCYDNCSDGDIRLVDDDEDGGRGRVEVCLGRYWGTVRDDGWDSNDATTVCRQLGYNTTNNMGIPTRRAFFGEGSGPIHWTRLQCKNDDTRLIDCDKETTGIDNNRDHGKDAGVICKGIGNCTDGEVRLVGGENEREGRVEICYNRVWGTVCDHGWDELDASVVCSQLGYGISVRATFSLGAGDGPILLNNVACNENHSELAQCVPKKEIGIHNCDQSNTAGVICSDPGGNSPATNNFNDTTSSIPTEQTAPLSAILGPLGGALIAGMIVAMVIAFIVVLKRRKIQKGSMDNPIYDEAIRIHVELPTGNSDLNMNRPHLEISPKPELAEYNRYQGLSANTMLDKALYESIRSSLLPGTVVNEEEEETSNGNESEVVYDVPPIEDDYDEICVSIEEATKVSYSEY